MSTASPRSQTVPPSGAPGFRTAVEEAARAGTALVLDGAMATELEKLGVDTSSELWSASALRDHPERVREVHEAYFRAGARVGTTNTYQANLPAFRAAGLSEKASDDLIRDAVTLAQRARDTTRPDGFVAGSVGPYGAYLADGSEYTGDYDLEDEAFHAFHRPRLRLLAEAGVDVIAVETMPQAAEVQAVCGLLAEEFPDLPAWVSLSIAPASAEETTAGGESTEAEPVLCDGTPLEEVARFLDAQDQVVAVGVNCTAIERVSPALTALRRGTGKPLLAYPNSGERYDPRSKAWEEGEGAASPAEGARRWAEQGAVLIGGCCRTGPEDVAGIDRRLEG